MHGVFVWHLLYDIHAYQVFSAGTGRKDIKLVSVSLAGKQLSSGQYQVTDKHLVIETLPKGDFDLEVEVDVKPKENTSLEGLYNSSGTFCTQCEAEGFRGITYFYDRSVLFIMITIIIRCAQLPGLFRFVLTEKPVSKLTNTQLVFGLYNVDSCHLGKNRLSLSLCFQEHWWVHVLH